MGRPRSPLTQKLWARFSKLEERQIDREWQGKFPSRADYLRHIIVSRPVVTTTEEPNPASPWLRARFHAAIDDSRPVLWPPPGPYWRTGEGDDYSTLVAYVKNEGQIFLYWPEATEIVTEPQSEITFTSRFPEPDWWKKAQDANAAPEDAR